MPQGKRIRKFARATRESPSDGAAEPPKPRGRAVRAPKSAVAAQRVHSNYLGRLGKWTDDFEHIAAGKVLASGSSLRLRGLRTAGKEQLHLVRESLKPKEPARTGKRSRRAKGTTKHDDLDDVSGAFVMESMGLSAGPETKPGKPRRRKSQTTPSTTTKTATTTTTPSSPPPSPSSPDLVDASAQGDSAFALH